MATAQKGDTVDVNYIGRLEDGTVFDTTEQGEPLSFTLGDEQVLEGFEEAVEGMKPGESKTVEVEPEKAYGEYREDMVIEMNSYQVSDAVDPQEGQQLTLRLEGGQTVPVIITAVNGDRVTIDANHPLAGRELEFDIELVDISQPNGEAPSNGEPTEETSDE